VAAEQRKKENEQPKDPLAPKTSKPAPQEPSGNH